MQEMNDLNGTGERQLYPRLEIIGQIGFEQLTERVAADTAFTTGDVKGVIAALQTAMAGYLSQGYSVKLDGIGSFAATLKMKKNVEPEAGDEDSPRHNARSIEINDVHFRCEKKFIQKISQGFSPRRSARKSRHSSKKYTPEQRLSLALEFLTTAPYLTISDYCELTGLLRAAAGKELRRWASDPASGLTASGYGTHRVYVRSQR